MANSLVFKSLPRLGVLALCLSLALGGCASQWSYREARGLLAEGQPDAALEKLQQANRQDPGNVELRNAMLLTRQKVLAQHLARATRAVEQRQWAEAQREYQRVLLLDPGHAAARDALQALQREQRHEPLLAQARTDFEQGRLEAARKAAAALLEENPRLEAARELLRQIIARQEAERPELRPLAALRKPISIEFREASLKQVFDVISRSSGLNILLDKDVKSEQRVSIALKDSTVDAALRYLLLTNQLEQQTLDANTVLVFPNNAGKLKEYQQLVVKTFVLANANAKAVAELLKTMVKSREIFVDDKLNMVILRDSPEAIRLAEKLVALQDVAEPEVMLEVEVLEVTRDRLTELGVRWPGSASLAPLSTASGGLNVSELRHLRWNKVGVSVDPTTLNAHQDDTDTDTLANPRIRVLNREKARIVIGNRVPSVSTSVIATGIVSESANYLDVGLKLDVEPIVYVNNDVAIKLTLEVSTVVGTQTSKQGTLLYTIGTRSFGTMLRLKDGENQVLAGLINDEDRRSAYKLPFLGDLPLAGRLFGSQRSDGKKTEVVLSITPRLVRNIERPVGEVGEFASGTEGMARLQPPAAALPAAAEAAAPAASAASAPP